MAVGEDGRIAWRFEVGDRVRSSPTVQGDWIWFGAHDGFVRGVLRGFARARKLRGLDRDAHFVLTRWADGRLSMHDPQTGHVVALEAFGPDNAAAFARLMRAPGADRARADQNHLKGARTRHGGSHAADNG